MFWGGNGNYLGWADSGWVCTIYVSNTWMHSAVDVTCMIVHNFSPLISPNDLWWFFEGRWIFYVTLYPNEDGAGLVDMNQTSLPRLLSRCLPNVISYVGEVAQFQRTVSPRETIISLPITYAGGWVSWPMLQWKICGRPLNQGKCLILLTVELIIFSLTLKCQSVFSILRQQLTEVYAMKNLAQQWMIFIYFMPIKLSLFFERYTKLCLVKNKFRTEFLAIVHMN